MRALRLALALALGGAALAAPADGCEGPPVIMMVRGTIEDRARLRTYAEALQASGLYPRLSGYYLNAPAPLAVFEGEVPAEESVLLVRFPCLAAARAFWFSSAYQARVRPARRNPSAGRFTVTVYPEISPPPHMAGRLDGGLFRPAESAAAVAAEPQVAPGTEPLPSPPR